MVPRISTDYRNDHSNGREDFSLSLRRRAGARTLCCELSYCNGRGLSTSARHGRYNGST